MLKSIHLKHAKLEYYCPSLLTSPSYVSINRTENMVIPRLCKAFERDASLRTPDRMFGWLAQLFHRQSSPAACASVHSQAPLRGTLIDGMLL